MKHKPKWLWSWEHDYYFDNHKYTYNGSVSDIDIADFLKIEKTSLNLAKIEKNWIKYEESLKDDPAFLSFLTDRYYEEASFEFRHKED